MLPQVFGLCMRVLDSSCGGGILSSRGAECSSGWPHPLVASCQLLQLLWPCLTNATLMLCLPSRYLPSHDFCVTTKTLS